MKPVPYVGKPTNESKIERSGEVLTGYDSFTKHRQTKDHPNCSLRFTFQTQLDLCSDVSPRIEPRRYE
jgi:hypothetical protein